MASTFPLPLADEFHSNEDIKVDHEIELDCLWLPEFSFTYCFGKIKFEV
jgi:hypothetical protein